MVKKTIAVERVWKKLEVRIRNTIVNKLAWSFNIQSLDNEDLAAEIMHIFFKYFYEKYEDDNQYCRFIFICFKNKMIDLFNREIRFYRTHKAIDSSSGEVNEKAGCVYTSDHRDQALQNAIFTAGRINKDFTGEDVELVDAISYIENSLDEEDVVVFRMMVEGYREFEIAEYLEVSPTVVGRIKRKCIWPAAKRAFAINDESYEKLCSSGRFYVTA